MLPSNMDLAPASARSFTLRNEGPVPGYPAIAYLNDQAQPSPTKKRACPEERRVPFYRVMLTINSCASVSKHEPLIAISVRFHLIMLTNTSRTPLFPLSPIKSISSRKNAPNYQQKQSLTQNHPGGGAINLVTSIMVTPICSASHLTPSKRTTYAPQTEPLHPMPAPHQRSQTLPNARRSPSADLAVFGGNSIFRGSEL